MLDSFIYQMLPARVVFGRGTSTALPAEAERLSLSRLLVLSTPEQASLAGHVQQLLGERAAGAFHGATMHTPVEVTVPLIVMSPLLIVTLLNVALEPPST